MKVVTCGYEWTTPDLTDAHTCEYDLGHTGPHRCVAFHICGATHV